MRRLLAPARWPIAWLIAGLAALYLPWTWSDQLASLGGDSAVYVLSAEHYAPYLPPDTLAADIARHALFPPLYALLLAATGGAADLHVAHAVTTLCLLAAVAAFFATLVAMGVPRAIGLVTVALFALLPGTLEQALQLKSEIPYLALTLAGLAALARASARANARDYWVATALLAAALLTRSAGVATQ
jgi:hypothetical protein